MDHDVRIRHITEGDWDDIVALEAGTYADGALSEGRAALRSRARSSPATCFVLEVGRQLAGYVLSLPYPVGQYPDLDREEEVVFHSRNLHLHDLVVGEAHRGDGLAGELLRRVTTAACAKRYQRISLVSVGGSEGFWSARGFHALREIALPASYGPDAVYMSMPVAADPRPDRRGPSTIRRADHPRMTK